jgi:hypothetical protein
MEANDRNHTIYRIMFPLRYRYAKPGSCRLETPHYRYVPHDASKGGIRGRQEWETDQGYNQEPRVGCCPVETRMSCQ